MAQCVAATAGARTLGGCHLREVDVEASWRVSAGLRAAALPCARLGSQPGSGATVCAEARSLLGAPLSAGAEVGGTRWRGGRNATVSAASSSPGLAGSGGGGDRGPGRGRGYGGGGDGNKDEDDSSADVRIGQQSGVVHQLRRGLQERLEVDPDFVFKLGVECMNDAGIILAVNYLQRGKRFFSELEFVICQLACSLLCDMTLVYLLAPLPVASAATLAASSAIARLPQHMFQRGPFTLAQRAGCYVYKGVLYGLIGCVNGGAGTALVHALTAAREQVDPAYVPPATTNPIGKSMLLWTAYLGLSSNTRYQLVNGLEQVLYGVFSQHLGVARAATIAMRLGNNFLGSLNYVWLAQATQLAVPRLPRRKLAAPVA
ncbi:hypothetical protein KFL_006820080 [Klebsormidium nitens]|uniref:Uncharacterized protein n=1 Tax=Klebsormidium nitens TaxID=105231 RepID=A0A1Y1IIS8_KLENI|nr:hypothetical protein KFL_006820080 [Klebsormidium nitens]|eukprot:GAQ90770.1 hypothetical protein KFL_006820080 [Klebsormidium nitens]